MGSLMAGWASDPEQGNPYFFFYAISVSPQNSTENIKYFYVIYLFIFSESPEE